MSKRWTYLSVEAETTMFGSLKPDQLQEQLNKHGQQGWELVNILIGSMSAGKPVLVFKKEN